MTTIFNRYAYHSKIISYLHELYILNYKENAKEIYSLSSNKISEILKINQFTVEKVLYELKEMNCLDFDKHNNSFKISEEGIKKHRSRFFSTKQRDYIISNVKEYLAIIVSLLAILSFTMTLRSYKSEVEKLENRIEILETRITSNK